MQISGHKAWIMRAQEMMLLIVVSCLHPLSISPLHLVSIHILLLILEFSISSLIILLLMGLPNCNSLPINSKLLCIVVTPQILSTVMDGQANPVPLSNFVWPNLGH